MIPAIIGAADGILSGLDALMTSDDERLEGETKQKLAELQLLAQRMKPQILELQIAQVQAQHPSWFVAGARPAFDWILNAGIAYGLIIAPFLNWAVMILFWQFGEAELPGFAQLPKLDWETIASAGALRVGSYGVRGWEKRGGVARENLATPTRLPSQPIAPQTPQTLWPS
ncbi:MAG: 3TM-type holin [Pseudomonadota bacterium]